MIDIMQFDDEATRSHGDVLVPRRAGFENQLALLLDKLGDDTGYATHFSNWTFELHPYCWCEQEFCPQCSGDQPNFYHRKSDLRISWYKYPFRGAFSNRKFDLAEFSEIIQDCINSLEE